MRVLRCAGGLIAAALLAAGFAPAQTVELSQTVTFGDSLTQNSILGFPFRIALYGEDPMEAVFHKGAVSGDRLTNYAVPGVESRAMLAEIGAYAASYLAGVQGLGTMISFEIGSNDVLDAWSLLSANPPGVDPAADAVITQLIQHIGVDLALLWHAHPGATFVVWTIPDITFTPRYWSERNTVRGANVRAHLARVNGLLRLLDGVPNIVVLDTESLIRQYATNPPVVKNQQLAGPPVTGSYAGLFADDVHPTAVANALVANEIIALVNAKWQAGIPSYTEAELAALARIP